MKRIIFLLTMMLTVTSGFAQGRFHRAPLAPVNFDECYEVTVDMDRLADRLQLTEEQIEYVQIIHGNMVDDIENAISKKGMVKMKNVDKAIKKSMKNMKRVLDEEQFETYQALLFATFRNNIYNTISKTERRPFRPFRMQRK